MKLFKHLRAAGLHAALALILAFSLTGMIFSPALATVQTLTPQNSIAPRLLTTQQTHYVRFAVDFNDCPLRAADTACSFRVASLPYNAFLVSISTQIITVFNPTTSATIALGTAAQSTNILAATNVFTGAATTAGFSTSFAGAGELVTGSGATPTGMNGGFDIWATYTVGAAGSQGTTGRVIFIIQYIAPNDGDCVPVPLGATATSC